MLYACLVTKMRVHNKAKIFLLVDLGEFFFRFRVGGMEKKSSENDQSIIKK